MTSQMSNTSIAAEEGGRVSVESLFRDHFIGEEVDFEECGPLSDTGFKVLVALVVVATFAFGCIVHGWLL